MIKTFELETPGKVSKKNPLLRSGQLQSTDNSNSSIILYIRNLTNLRSSDVGTKPVTTKDRGSIDLSEGSISWENEIIRRNCLNISIQLTWLHSVSTHTQIEQHTALARNLEIFKIDLCCVSETRIQDPTSVVNFRSPGII